MHFPCALPIASSFGLTSTSWLRKKERKKDDFKFAINVNYGVTLFSSWSKCKYGGVIWLHFCIGHLYLIVVWLGEDKKKNPPYKHIFQWYWTMFSSFINCSTLYNEHNWEDLCIKVINQQSCNSDNHNYIMDGRIFSPLLLMLHHTFANLTQVSLCKSN